MKRLLILTVLILIILAACDSNSTSSNQKPEPPFDPTPSHSSTNVANNVTLRWTCVDPDNDDLTYSVYLGEDDLVMVASGLTNAEYTPETLDYSTDYHWKVAAYDGHETTKSPRWDFRTISENYPPNDPMNPNPEDGVIDMDVNQVLGWYCYDVNGDKLTFDVKLGTTDNPPVIASNIEAFQFPVNNLAYHTIYYWQIVAKSTDKETIGPLWSFETKYYNYPPEKPYDPLPNDHNTGISTHTQLSWRCDDIEDDPLSYDVYLGTENNPVLMSQGLEYSTFDPGVLEPLTDYYWRIDAWDGSHYSHGPVWHFVTGEQNTAPEIPYAPWPQDGATGEVVDAMLRWSCSDPDGDDLVYKIYFGTVSQLTENHVIALGITDESWGLGRLDYNTTYYWRVKAHDGDLEVQSPVWSFTTEEN